MRAPERLSCSSSSPLSERAAHLAAAVSYHAARGVALRRRRSGVAQWQSERLLIVRLWVRVPPPELPLRGDAVPQLRVGEASRLRLCLQTWLSRCFLVGHAHG